MNVFGKSLNKNFNKSWNLNHYVSMGLDDAKSFFVYCEDLFFIKTENLSGIAKAFPKPIVGVFSNVSRAVFDGLADAALLGVGVRLEQITIPDFAPEPEIAELKIDVQTENNALFF